MTTEERVLRAVFSAIDQVNVQLPREQRLEKSIRSGLLDGAGNLDSLGMVNLIVAAEQNIEEEFGTPISLLNEEAFSENDGPFRNVDTLVRHIARLLEEKERE
jgi:acyl carrier protein